MNRDFRGPDFFVVLDVDGEVDRKSWIVWEENGRYPDVIVELMSNRLPMWIRRSKRSFMPRPLKHATTSTTIPKHKN